MVAVFFITGSIASSPAAAEPLVSEQARSFAGIERLALQKMSGQDFWFFLKALPEDQSTGLENEPFLKNAGYLFFNSPINHIGQSSPLRKRINPTGGKIPVLCYMMGEKGWGGNRYHPGAMEDFKTAEAQAWLKEWGDDFIGLTHLEGNWNVVKTRFVNDQWPAVLKMPFPTNKEESYSLVEAYFKKFMLLNNLPVLPGSIGFLDHHTLRWGARATTTYFGSNLLYAQLQSAFARGAARQFGKLWHVYYANYGLCVNLKLKGEGVEGVFDGQTQFCHRSPEITTCETYVENNTRQRYMLAGARLGADVKTSMRPNYYFCYMAGANSLQNESDSTRFRYAGYNPHGRTESPLARNFRNDKTYPSPVVDLYREIDSYARRQPRGTPCTPVAIMLDRHHGYIYPKKTTCFTFAPLERGDHQINELFDALFPFKLAERSYELAQKASYLREVPAEHCCFHNLPYGNFFDVLTNDCSLETLSAYPVVLLTGLQGNWPDLTEKLVRYVKDGGTLAMDASQIRREMPAEMTGVETCGEWLDGKGHIDRRGNQVAEKPYAYQKLKLLNGEALHFDSDSKLPLLVRTKYGKGIVLFCSVPHFLDKEEKENPRLLKLCGMTLGRMLDEVLPVRVKVASGSIDYSLNKIGNGWLATLINYDGVTHGMGQEPVIDKSLTAQIRLEADGNYDVIETISGEKVEYHRKDGRTILKIPVLPGDVKIIKLSH